jgi:predicted TIM-barrel fold metal-dependent hydrolase
LVDTHIHIYRSQEEGRQQKEGGYVIWEYGEKADVRFSKYDGDLEDALDAIQKCGFYRAAVMNLFTPTRSRAHTVSALPDGLSDDERSRQVETIDAAMAESLIEFNQWICDLVEPHDQLVPFVAADPAALPGERGAAHLRDMVENHGARGIKLHPVLQDFHASDRRMWPVYEACQALGVAVVSHSGPASGGEPYAEPHAFAEMLEAFPRLTVVVAHLGGATWGQALELARGYPNAYFDCCEIIEWCGAPDAPSDQELGQLIRDIGADRVMMGSDFPWYDLDRQVERVMELPVLSREEKEGVVGANAIRILGL